MDSFTASVGTQPPTQLQTLRDVARAISRLLPQQWSEQSTGGRSLDGVKSARVLEFATPNGERLVLLINVSRSIEPRDIPRAVSRATSLAESVNGVPVVAATYLSPRSRTILEDSGVGYADTTGVVRIASGAPGLFILVAGADRDPWPRQSGLQSLRGRGSARAVRALVDSIPPLGIRELAAKSGASPASLSRVADLLDREALIARTKRGPITEVDWVGVIQRWARDYDQMRSNTVYRFLTPRGLAYFEKRLIDTDSEFAATGAFAAQQFDPVAPARVVTVYTENPFALADALDLREADNGINVILLEPYDRVVFDGTLIRDGLPTVTPSQLAVDLLTGPGRERSQGEEILEWMKGNEHGRRT